MNQSELGGYKQQLPLTFLHASINKKTSRAGFCVLKESGVGEQEGCTIFTRLPLSSLGGLDTRDRQTDRQTA